MQHLHPVLAAIVLAISAEHAAGAAGLARKRTVLAAAALPNELDDADAIRDEKAFVRSPRNQDLRSLQVMSSGPVAATERKASRASSINESYNSMRHMRRETAAPSTLLEHEEAALSEIDAAGRSSGVPEGADRDGIVKVENAATNEGDAILAAEDTRACMIDVDLAECMKKFGSYGLRRLFTESWQDIKNYKWHRPEWMSHANVQNKKVFDLTLPMTRASGSYEAEAGADKVISQTQNLDIHQQLSLGVRALDIPVAVDVKNVLHTAHHVLTVDLNTVLLDIKRFLSKYKKEVVFLFASKATLVADVDVNNGASILPLQQEENDASKIPGELVHAEVQRVLSNFVADYSKLSNIPSASRQNPKVEELVSAGARLIYFWEGQQVLCMSHASCLSTPGWSAHIPGTPLPFGAPQALGARDVEPGCYNPSQPETASSNPLTMVRNIEVYAKNPPFFTAKAPPSCMYSSAAVPATHKPNLFYEGSAYLTLTAEMQLKLDGYLAESSEVFTKGEALTVRSNAERANFLMLNWAMKKGGRGIFQQFNLLSVDFVAPIVVHRIVEAVQVQKECGFMLTCKETGSCFAQSLLSGEGDCLEETAALKILEEHAGNKWPLWKTILLFACLGLIVKLILFLIYRRVSPYAAFPRFERNYDFCGCVWWRKEDSKKAATQGLEQAVADLQTSPSAGGDVAMAPEQVQQYSGSAAAALPQAADATGPESEKQRLADH